MDRSPDMDRPCWTCSRTGMDLDRLEDANKTLEATAYYLMFLVRFMLVSNILLVRFIPLLRFFHTAKKSLCNSSSNLSLCKYVNAFLFSPEKYMNRCFKSLYHIFKSIHVLEYVHFSLSTCPFHSCLEMGPFRSILSRNRSIQVRS